MAVNEADRRLIAAAYEAFNARDVDRAVALMALDVDWPNGMDGGRVHGHDGVRAYWTDQWQQIDPHVEPTSMDATETGTIAVEVHQVVRSLEGDVLVDTRVVHDYAVRAGLIVRMDIR